MGGGVRGTRVGVPALFAVVMLCAGCASTAELDAQRGIISRQIGELDSLRALNYDMAVELTLLRDSLQFIDDIETGQYYRDMRSLEDRIRQLEFIVRQQRIGITVAELPADELFAPASSNLTTAGIALLDSVANVISRAFPYHEIRVEGHADSAPLGPSLEERYGSNWGLSTARAASVVSHLVDERGLRADRIGASGFGSARPLVSNDTPAGRRQNRRVRVAAVPTGALTADEDAGATQESAD